MISETELRIPPKYNILGVNISATTYQEVLNFVINAALSKKKVCITHLAVHGLVLGSRNFAFRSMLNEFDILAPDGQPVRYALNLLYKLKIPDRCYGPEFMIRVCQSAEAERIPIYLYGSHKHVVEALCKNLVARHPRLEVAGCEPSKFRPLNRKEDEELMHRIRDSGARIIFLGLGCPLQERFAIRHKNRIRAVQICVGAAFDFHSGEKKMAPYWMQQHSLEWLFRLSREPKRLWKRYLFTNTPFLLNLFLQFARIKKFSCNE